MQMTYENSYNNIRLIFLISN